MGLAFHLPLESLPRFFSGVCFLNHDLIEDNISQKKIAICQFFSKKLLRFG